MSKDEYYDFKLELKYDQDQVFVRCPKEGIDFGESTAYFAPNIDGAGSLPLSNFWEIGDKIAAMLLPPGKIRDRFIKIWQYGKQKIRLRLCYPIKETEDDANNQIDFLMRVPWEYIYLSKQADDPQIGSMTRFLALRDEVSIVHSLRPVKTGTPQRRTYVNQLKVNMKYFSWLGSDNPSAKEDADQSIFRNFVDEFLYLRPLLDCANINDAPILTNSQPPPAAESHHLRIALQTDDLIHLTCHGDPDSISLPDGELNLKEWVLQTDSMQKIKAKAIILLSCDSGGAIFGTSIVRELNQRGMPVVIGMTRNINFEAAGRFVGGFYYALASWPSEGLEKAVVHGRLSILNLEADILDDSEDEPTEEGGNWNAGFGIPRLFLNSKLSDSILIRSDDLYDTRDMLVHVNEYILRLIANAPIPMEDQAAIIKRNKESFKSWIEGDQSMWLWVTGQPGATKSTQIAQFINEYLPELPNLRAKNVENENDEKIAGKIKEFSQEGKSKIIYHLYDNDYPDTGDPLAFVQHLVSQLISYFGDKYYRWCPRGRFPLLTGSAQDALIDFIYIPLYEARKRREIPPVIIIDGIDHVPQGQGFDNSILGLLRDNHDKLDNVARFLITSDEVTGDGNGLEQNVQQALKDITQGAERLRILPPKSSPEDVKSHLEEKLKGTGMTCNYSRGTGVLKFGQPKPIPLFDRMIDRFMSLLQTSDIPPEIMRPSLEVDQWTSPEGLEKLYKYALDIAKHIDQQQGEKEKGQQFLDIVTLAYEPLLLCDVAAIIDVSDDEVNKLLKIFWPFLSIPVDSDVLKFFHEEGNSLKFYHHSLRDFVLRDMSQERVVAAHKLFVDAFLPPNTKPDWANLSGTEWQKRRAANNCKDNTSQQNNSLIPSYVRRYLSYHAYECYRGIDWSKENPRRDQANIVLKLICDPGFRRVHRTEVGRDAVVQDIRNGLRVVYTEYALPNNGKDNSTLNAIDRIMAANEFNFQYLEQQLRNAPKAGTGPLFDFLGLKEDSGRLEQL